MLQLLVFLYCATAQAQWAPPNPVVAVEKQGDGVLLTMTTGALKLQVVGTTTVRVLYTATASFPPRSDFVVIKKTFPEVDWTLQATDVSVTLATNKLQVVVNRRNGSIVFKDAAGKRLFGDSRRSLTPAEVNGETTYHAEMFSELWGSSEAFYGLGQHQSGILNYRGSAVDLTQENTNISIPLFLSSYGYGILWNNSSRSRFNNRFLDALFITSEVADLIDYYFVYGPDFDQIIAGYRQLTGQAPMFGRWAYGLWQSKNRYQTQEELLSVAHKYRELHIPIDNIVQDWYWWNLVGEMRFDPKRFPDPKGMFHDLHENNFHAMISAWPLFEPGSRTYEDMDNRGFFIDKMQAGGSFPAGTALYDAFNPQAQQSFWNLLDRNLFEIGADGWWLDADEPETSSRETSILVTGRTALGNGARYANMYPLMHTGAVYRGQRVATNEKRVFILSRSAFLGSQRNAAAAWSGDVEGSWTFFKKQIPAGLNFSMSGLPYWTTDIGGFWPGNPDDPAYRELFVRWFQFGTFNPLFRVHGTRKPDHNELWSYGADAQSILLKFDTLRYRLLPYIYSLAWMTTHADYTPMRALVMDFRNDVRVADLTDQFMFGPALMVNPVTDPGVDRRPVYLPAATWYDFWTGATEKGPRTVITASELDRLPLYVRAGSILPLGPKLEWSTQQPADPVELRIYRGADADFLLYEDENDNYNYERGLYSTITLHWSDAGQELTIGGRQGKYPGMPASRTFRVVFVAPGHGVGEEAEAQPDRVVQYQGKAISVSP